MAFDVLATHKELSTVRDEIRDEISQLQSSLLNKIYPVGSIYLSVVNTSPATFLGGTWVALSAGYVLKTVTSGTGGATTAAAATGAASGTTANSAAFNTGGPSNNSTSATKLEISQIPSHTHTQNAHSHYLRIRMANTEGTSVNAFAIPMIKYLYNFPAGKGGKVFSADPNVTNLTDNFAASVLNATATNQATGGSGTHTHTLNNHTHSVGAHSHGLNSHTHTTGMPANISVYAWKRTA